MKTVMNKLKLIMIIPFFMLQSCGGNDKDIKADLATKAEEQKDFAGVNFTVSNHVVTLSGNCPTLKSKSSVETTTKGIYGVKQVVNNIQVAPVVIGTDQLLKKGIDSILKEYPGITAVTKDSIVYLQGKVPDEKVVKLKDAINTLKPKAVDARLN
jgi:hypothetical protein